MLFTIFLLILFVLSLRYKNNLILFILLLLCGMALIGLNYDNPDYTSYVGAYNRAKYPTEFNVFEILDIGYTIISAYAKSIRILDYEEFRLYVSVILFIIFGITISKFCKYRNIFLVMYLLFYIWIDEIQLRNFISFVIILPAFLYYINNQNIKGMFVYLAGIVVGFTFHFSAVFYLLFCATIIKNKYFKYIILLVCLVALSGLEFGVTKIAMLKHVESYDKPTTLGGIVGCIIFIANYLYIWWLNRTYVEKHLNPSYRYTAIIQKQFEALMQVNFFLMLLCPMMFMNGTILRIWRFVSMVNIIYIINVLYCCRQRKTSWKITATMLIYALFVTLRSNADGVFPSLFNNPIFE